MHFLEKYSFNTTPDNGESFLVFDEGSIMFMFGYSLIYSFCDLSGSVQQCNSYLLMLELKEWEGVLLIKLEQNNIGTVGPGSGQSPS